MRGWVSALTLALTLAACTGPVAAPMTEPPTASASLRIALPPPGARFDYQLGGGYPPPSGVRVVERDSTQAPAAGAYGICYVNAFQTQPDAGDWWLAHHPDLVLRAGRTPVVDPGWPDEYLLDTSSRANRAAIAEVVGQAILGCARAGYDAVELDNLDSYTRSGGRLTAEDALDLAARLVAVGHGAGLAVAQKNAAELSTRAHSVGFDLAIAEECHRWDECAAYSGVYGSHVLDVEYTDDLRGAWSDVCADPQTPASVVLRDRDLVTPADPAHAYRHC